MISYRSIWDYSTLHVKFIHSYLCWSWSNTQWGFFFFFLAILYTQFLSTDKLFTFVKPAFKSDYLHRLPVYRNVCWISSSGNASSPHNLSKKIKINKYIKKSYLPRANQFIFIARQLFKNAPSCWIIINKRKKNNHLKVYSWNANIQFFRWLYHHQWKLHICLQV